VDGRTEDALAYLLERAGQRDDLELAWQAGGSAIEIMFWCDEFSRAAALSEALIRDLGPRGTGLDDQLLPFSPALLAADAFAGEPALPRVQAAAAVVPADSPLGRQLARSAERLITTTADEQLAIRPPWEMRRRRLGRPDREVLERDWNSLEGPELWQVWSAVTRANDFDLALQVLQVRQEAPTYWPGVMWLVQWLVHDGQLDRAAEIMRDGRGAYLPHAPWNLLPDNPPVDPLLRRALTPEVRRSYLDGMREPLTDA